ncbi:polysaccharide deacetylase family protein [Aquibacillus saliphilus]|uniref:polysaccharide deacetylase family protein n=1 Tax=Aquibacillus saliphilus TaxID=1909422 RepID=UPI001CF0668C|nr:polysaccharide deacetylase family protein [Aquibacillus saliphilus]
MKKILFTTLLFFLFLVGCSSDEQPQNQVEEGEDATEEPEQPDDSVDIDTGNNQDNTVPEEDEIDAEIEEEEQEEQETLEPLYQLTENWNLEPISEEDNANVVLLTIDDAPDEHALEMAKTLKELDAPAIFFVNGHFLDTDEEKEILKKIHDLGFEIGNHTYNHQNLSEVSEEQQKKEIVELSDLIEEVIGERPKYFRAPHGVNPDYSKQMVKDEGMLLMNWTYGYDYFKPYMDAEKLTTAMVTGEGPEVDVPYSLLKPGANLLMHDREWTAKALEDIVNGLREKGFEMLDPKLIKTP